MSVIFLINLFIFIVDQVPLQCLLLILESKIRYLVNLSGGACKTASAAANQRQRNRRETLAKVIVPLTPGRAGISSACHTLDSMLVGRDPNNKRDDRSSL